jgi:hypothetical protein
MPKTQRRKSLRPETIQRNAMISSFRARMAFSVRGKEPDLEIEGRPSLELRGKLLEPIRDSEAIVIKLWPDPDKRVGPARPAAVAHIMRVRPEIEVLANFHPTDFNYVWTLALSGNLTNAYMNFTKPHYGSAEVLSLAFSNEVEE